MERIKKIISGLLIITVILGLMGCFKNVPVYNIIETLGSEIIELPIPNRAVEYVNQQLAIMRANPAHFSETLAFTEVEIMESEIGNQIKIYIFDENGQYLGFNINNFTFPFLYYNEIIGIIEVAYLPDSEYDNNFAFTFGKSYGIELNKLVNQHAEENLVIGNLGTRLLFAIIGEEVSVFKHNYGEAELTKEQIENILTSFNATVESPDYFRFSPVLACLLIVIYRSIV